MLTLAKFYKLEMGLGQGGPGGGGPSSRSDSSRGGRSSDDTRGASNKASRDRAKTKRRSGPPIGTNQSAKTQAKPERDDRGVVNQVTDNQIDALAKELEAAFNVPGTEAYDTQNPDIVGRYAEGDIGIPGYSTESPSYDADLNQFAEDARNKDEVSQARNEFERRFGKDDGTYGNERKYDESIFSGYARTKTRGGGGGANQRVSPTQSAPGQVAPTQAAPTVPGQSAPTQSAPGQIPGQVPNTPNANPNPQVAYSPPPNVNVGGTYNAPPPGAVAPPLSPGLTSDPSGNPNVYRTTHERYKVRRNPTGQSNDLKSEKAATSLGVPQGSIDTAGVVQDLIRNTGVHGSPVVNPGNPGAVGPVGVVNEGYSASSPSNLRRLLAERERRGLYKTGRELPFQGGSRFAPGNRRVF